MDWSGTEWNVMEGIGNGMDWIGTEWNGTECVFFSSASDYCLYAIATYDGVRRSSLPDNIFDTDIKLAKFRSENLTNLTMQTLLYGTGRDLRYFGSCECNYMFSEKAQDTRFGFVYFNNVPVYDKKSARILYMCCAQCAMLREVSNLTEYIFLILRSAYFTLMASHINHHIEVIHGSGISILQDVFSIEKATARMFRIESKQWGCPHSKDSSPVESFMDRGICAQIVYVKRKNEGWHIMERNGLVKDGFALFAESLRIMFPHDKHLVDKTVDIVYNNVGKEHCFCVNLYPVDSFAIYRSFCFYLHSYKHCQDVLISYKRKYEVHCAHGESDNYGSNKYIAISSNTQSFRRYGRFCSTEILLKAANNENDEVTHTIYLGAYASLAKMKINLSKDEYFFLKVLEIINETYFFAKFGGKIVEPHDSSLNCKDIKVTSICKNNFCQIANVIDVIFNKTANSLTIMDMEYKTSIQCDSNFTIRGFFRSAPEIFVKVFSTEWKIFVRIIPRVNAIVLNYYNRPRLFEKPCRYVEALLFPNTVKASKFNSYLPMVFYVCKCDYYFCPEDKYFNFPLPNNTDEFYWPSCFTFKVQYNSIPTIATIKPNYGYTFVCYTKVEISLTRQQISTLKWNETNIGDVITITGGPAYNSLLESSDFMGDAYAFNMRSLTNSPRSRCVLQSDPNNTMVLDSVICFCRLSFFNNYQNYLLFHRPRKIACNDFEEVVNILNDALSMTVESYFRKQKMGFEGKQHEKYSDHDDDLMTYASEFRQRCNRPSCHCALTINCSDTIQLGKCFDVSDPDLLTLCQIYHYKLLHPCFLYNDALTCCIILSKTKADMLKPIDKLLNEANRICQKSKLSLMV
ncbi:unnamed protein product [Thelazia callipaeda]|uniref:Sema domain-containing protein n=1 Tax=Thelazia callipaeda TaxID=103827 RepID=A0A158RD37_THECL|nr:unnamed protein product [Thelazia callipaeda]